MGFDFAAAKARVRRVVQDTLAVPALYMDNSLNAPIELRARWHTKQSRVGELNRDGYAETFENVERIVLIPEIWTTDINGVSVNTGTIAVLRRNGRIEFPAYDSAYLLAVAEPATGPLEVAWQLSEAGLRILSIDPSANVMALSGRAMAIDGRVFELTVSHPNALALSTGQMALDSRIMEIQ